MNGLYKGAYVVTIVPSIGGSKRYDVGFITSGRGISSELWVICSLQTWTKYSVTAMQIARDSYYNNIYVADAELIYKLLTGKEPVCIPKPSVPL